jgi:hypothetical protein
MVDWTCLLFIIKSGKLGRCRLGLGRRRFLFESAFGRKALTGIELRLWGDADIICFDPGNNDLF